MKNNIPENISIKRNSKLHLQQNHPIEILKRKIYDYFGDAFSKHDNFSEIVTTEKNFDLLLIPENHPSRRLTDTYYYDEFHVLRTHTSAHQIDLLKERNKSFLVTGDCYRRDEIDSTHFPVFHQMEGVKILDNSNENEVKKDLLTTLTGLIKHLFPDTLYRITDSYFPFTAPSFEFEIFWNDKWIEVLGCGCIHPQVLENGNCKNQNGWAFGMGLERLAMILFKIPDIRIFWSTDKRFLDQFYNGEIAEFKSYSKFPECYKDIAFWINEEFHYNDFCELVRETGDDLVESVKLIDEFTHPKTGLTSHCYRISYRSYDRSLTNQEINEKFSKLQNLVSQKLNLKIRM